MMWSLPVVVLSCIISGGCASPQAKPQEISKTKQEAAKPQEIAQPKQEVAKPKEISKPEEIPVPQKEVSEPKEEKATAVAAIPSNIFPLNDEVQSLASEQTILRSLRWLKQNQQADGSWRIIKPAMTSFALLTFLGHGETTKSEEFGKTVEKAIGWLIANQTPEGRFKESDANEYSLPIAAFALSEAARVTKDPKVIKAAEKSIRLIVEGQHPSGGWNYRLNQDDRDDTCYMSWCAQAVKAACIAKLNVQGLDVTMKKAINGFRKNFAGNAEQGGFGYTGPGSGGLTAAGVLCSQLMGAPNSTEVKSGLKTLDGKNWEFNFGTEAESLGKQSLYYWYYATQAKLHAGIPVWNKWYKKALPVFLQTQHVVSKQDSGYKDNNNEAQETGYWDQFKGHGSDNNPVFATILCTLQMEVCYQNLSTFNVSGIWLEPVTATDEERKAIETLIPQLGSKDPKERKAANEKLRAYGAKAGESLEKALSNPDPEISMQAKEILFGQ